MKPDGTPYVSKFKYDPAETVVIAAAGPSCDYQNDWEKLNQYPTIVINHALRAIQKHHPKNHPDYWLAIDPPKDFEEELFINTEAVYVTQQHHMHYALQKKCKRYTTVQMRNFSSGRSDPFGSKYFPKCTYSLPFAVLFAIRNLQAKTILLYGVDLVHNGRDHWPSTQKPNPNNEEWYGKDARPGYFPEKRELWSNRRKGFHSQISELNRISEIGKDNGIRLFSLSETSKLNTFLTYMPIDRVRTYGEENEKAQSEVRTFEVVESPEEEIPTVSRSVRTDRS